jgi:arylformamidase
LDRLRNERDYVFSDRYPERGEIYRLFDERSDEARRSLPCKLDLPYGSHPRERFDLFPGSGGPLVIFVHGGYWRSLSKERFSYVAAPLVRMGFTVALPGYPLTPDVPLRGVFDSIKRSVPAIFAAVGGATPWIVAGHSAGGHLAAMLAAMDWREQGISQPACLPISGIFALDPLIETSLNRDLRLDEALAAEMSPLRTPPCGPLRIVVGADETPGFLRQSADYFAHCRSAGRDAELVQLSGRNHYTIVGELLEESSVVAQQFALLACGPRHERE